MRPVIEETSTITVTGQTTVPKAVRRALGVDYGGKIAFRVEGGRVTVHNPETEHRDPALTAFLGLIEQDVALGRNLGDLPSELVSTMRHAIRHVEIDLSEPLASGVEDAWTRLANIDDGLGRYMLTHPNARYTEAAAALKVSPEAVQLPVKYWKQVILFLSEQGALRIATRDLPSGSAGRGKRQDVWRHMQGNPSARAADVAAALGLTRGAVEKPVRYWKQIVGFLKKEGRLRTR